MAATNARPAQRRRSLQAPWSAAIGLVLLTACSSDHLIGSAGFVASSSFDPQLAGLREPVFSTGDLDGDQREDVAILDAQSGRLCLLWGEADGWSAPACQTLPTDDAVRQVAVARLVADGRAQLVLLGRDLQLFPPLLRGPLPSPRFQRALAPPVLQLRTSSLPVTRPSDGRTVDVLWTTHGTPQPKVSAWFATASPDQASALDLQPVDQPLGTAPTAFVAHASAQGQRELFVATQSGIDAWSSDGRMQPLPCAADVAHSVDLAVVDVTQDSRSDVLALRADGRLAVIQRPPRDGSPDWSCAATAPLPGQTWTALLPADFDGDGRTDVLGVSANRDPGAVLWRSGQTTPAYPQPLPVQAAALMHTRSGSRPDVLLLLRDGSLQRLRNHFLP